MRNAEYDQISSAELKSSRFSIPHSAFRNPHSSLPLQRIFVLGILLFFALVIQAHVPVRDIQFHLRIERNFFSGECYWVVGDRRWVYDLRDRADVNFDGKIDDLESEGLRKFLWDRLSSSISFRNGKVRIPLKFEKIYAGGLNDPVGSAYPITLRIVLQEQTFDRRKPLLLTSTHPSAVYVKWKDAKGASHEAVVERGVITLIKPM
ncbi:MAG TPA: hypothetical protein VGK99_23400 [Acidobacteriota bacterium]|jgi:hypothetical protein